MDSNAIYWIVLFLIASAFFSASETSLFSLSKLQQKKLESSDRKSDKRILKLLSKPRLLLITILLGNTLVNISISSFATIYSLYLKQHLNWSISESAIVSIQVIVTTILILLLGEIVPKLVAWAKASHIARIVTAPLRVMEFVFYPILKLLELLSNAVSVRKNLAPEEEITAEEFQTLIHSQNAVHNLEDHEKKILAGLFRLPKAEIREIIVPRVHITAIEESESLDDLKETIRESGYSRIPVFRGTIDDIIGVVYAKDILLHPQSSSISELMRPAWFVTENMKIQLLLNQFKSKKTQIAIVVDEYGGTSGIITLEDIMEELVGDIQDEYDVDEVPALERIDDDTLIVNGMYGIRELNTELFTVIDPEKYDNLADFLLEAFNHIPKVQEKFVYEDKVEFIIEDSSRQRINKVRIHKIRSSEEEQRSDS